MSLTGDWGGVTRKLERLSDDIKKEVGHATALSLQQIERQVVGHINKQDLNWPKLSPRYAAYKARTRNPSWRRKRRKAGKENPRSLSEKILVATGAFRQAITSFQHGPFSGEVGVSRNETYSGGQQIANIGAIMEEGSDKAGIPARELWGPTADEMQERVKKNYLNAVARVVYA